MTKRYTSVEEIIKWCDKNIKYSYYSDGKYLNPKVELMKRRAFNCSDRVGE